MWYGLSGKGSLRVCVKKKITEIDGVSLRTKGCEDFVKERRKT